MPPITPPITTLSAKQLALWTPDETDPPWFQRMEQGEGPEPFSWFLAFLNLDGTRSVRRAWMSYAQKSGGIPPPSWYDSSKRFEWKDRASAYDKATGEDERRRVRTELLEARQGRIVTFQMAQNRLLGALDHLDPLEAYRNELIDMLKKLPPGTEAWDDMLKAINKVVASPGTPKLGEVMTGIKNIMGELRIEHGDEPKYRPELKPNEQPQAAQSLHITLKGVSTDDL